MGNSLRVVLDNYIGTAPFPCHLQLGRSAAIDLYEVNSLFLPKGWKIYHTVDGSTCKLESYKCVGQDGNVHQVNFVLRDSKYLNCHCIKLSIETSITDSNFLHIPYVHHVHSTSLLTSCSCSSVTWIKNRIVDGRGGVTDTQLYFYGSGNRWGLVVLECYKNSRDHEEDNYNAVTVAHYLANSSGIAFNRTESDIGLSIVAKIRSSNGNLDMTVEGPQQHPPSALFYMFDEVHRTGIWKPTMCPHCARVQRGRMSWQSDSDDNDGVRLPPHGGSHQNGRSIANGGRFRGHGNGSSIFCRYFNAF